MRGSHGVQTGYWEFVQAAPGFVYFLYIKLYSVNRRPVLCIALTEDHHSFLYTQSFFSFGRSLNCFSLPMRGASPTAS